MKRQFSIPESITHELTKSLGNLDELKKIYPHLTEDIVEISKHFQLQSRKTEISSERFQRAYMVYFHCLNAVRARAVLTELKRLVPNFRSQSWLDFGSGLGAIEHAFYSVFDHTPLFTFVEESDSTQKLHKKIRPFQQRAANWVHDLENVSSSFDTISASFSVNELKVLPEKLFQAKTLMFIEPSTQYHTRRLMALRSELIQRGYSLIAPCVHSLGCPLLTQSQTDWCYDRIFFDRPPWFTQIEDQLPMTNRTLTFSYLIASQEWKRIDDSGLARVIGDTLREKGKTKQMVCRGPEREFLSWLDRDGSAPEIAHGSLVKLKADLVKKGSELRCPPGAVESLS